MTSNNLEVTPDLMRRAVFVELFIDVDIETRRFDRVIGPGYFTQQEVRSACLAACAAIVRHWIAAGETPGPDDKPTFEAWSRVIGGMVASLPNGGDVIGRPLSRPSLPMSGDRRSEEMRSLLVALASEAELAGELTVVWTTTNIIDMGRRERLLEDMLGARKAFSFDVNAACAGFINAQIGRAHV